MTNVATSKNTDHKKNVADRIGVYRRLDLETLTTDERSALDELHPELVAATGTVHFDRQLKPVKP